VGPALTIRTCGRDSTIVHKAIGLISPGDVLVIDRCGDTRYACVGEMMAIAAGRRGAAGIVIDGPATDVEALRALGLPIFSRATSPVTTLLLGESGSINVPVMCGGVAVRPGELVLADDDGVIVLDPDEAATLLAGVLEEDREDAEYRDELLAGRLPVELAPIDQLIGEANDHA
jgi:regulator of RNase E activity RraA